MADETHDAQSLSDNSVTSALLQQDTHKVVSSLTHTPTPSPRPEPGANLSVHAENISKQNQGLKRQLAALKAAQKKPKGQAYEEALKNDIFRILAELITKLLQMLTGAVKQGNAMLAKYQNLRKNNPALDQRCQQLELQIKQAEELRQEANQLMRHDLVPSPRPPAPVLGDPEQKIKDAPSDDNDAVASSQKDSMLSRVPSPTPEQSSSLLDVIAAMPEPKPGNTAENDNDNSTQQWIQDGKAEAAANEKMSSNESSGGPGVDSDIEVEQAIGPGSSM